MVEYVWPGREYAEYLRIYNNRQGSEYAKYII